MYKYSISSEEKLKHAHPNLQSFFKELIKITPYDIGIGEVLRAAEKQNSYYQQGRTKKGSIITYRDGYKSKSEHQEHSDGYSHAVDIYIYSKDYKKILWDIRIFREIVCNWKVRKLMQKYGIEWGGDWEKPEDAPHFQIRKGV